MSSLKVRTNQQVTESSPPPREVRDSTLQNSTLHNWFRHVPSCWFGHVPTQLTMDSTEDTAVFNAVDGARCQRVQGNAVDYAAECKWSRVMKQSGIASNELGIVVLMRLLCRWLRLQ